MSRREKKDKLTREEYGDVVLGVLIIFLLLVAFILIYYITGYIFRYTKISTDLFILYNQSLVAVIFTLIAIYGVRFLFEKKAKR